MAVKCPTCGTENREPSPTCFFCGAVLPGETPSAPPAVPAQPAPSPPPAQAPRPAPRDSRTDFVGLFGLAFFLLIVGVVFYLNANLVTDLRRWWDQILAGRILFRPPEGVITSAVLFWGLIGGTNFVIAGLRWIVGRSKIRTSGAALGGVAMIVFAFLLNRYAGHQLSGSQVLSFEAAVIGALLFIYIGFGLYWTTTRRRPAVEGTLQAPRP